jgi:hypothetical protein
MAATHSNVTAMLFFEDRTRSRLGGGRVLEAGPGAMLFIAPAGGVGEEKTYLGPLLATKRRKIQALADIRQLLA